VRVELAPHRVSVVPGQPAVLTVQVFNTSPVISGYQIRVLGVDERWVSIDQDQLSLFPEAIGIAVLTITLPKGIPAGTRRIGIQVRELTPPSAVQVVEAELTVPAELSLRLGMDPVSATGGKTATFGVLVENSGNTDMSVKLAGADEEAKVAFVFEPSEITLAPGERLSATAQLKARRKFAGTPKVRPFTVSADGMDPPVSAFGTFVQKPMLSRGAISLIGLLLAVTVFAAVITASFSKVVDKSAADRDLVLQVVNGSQAGGGAQSASMGGTVTLLTSGTGVNGVTVEAFDAANTAQAITSTATDAAGGYKMPSLNAGTYKLRFRGAGFSELWYPQSLTPDNAKPVEVQQGQTVSGLDVRLGGVPAKLTGKVIGDDPSGATVSLELPTARPNGAIPVSTGTAATAPGTQGAVVETATVDATGVFTLDKIPSPSTYDIVVQKTGYATEVQQVDLGGGEQRTGIEILLRKGDGSISGHVSGSDGPLGGATVTASDGHTTITTVSLTQDDVGGFTLRSLPTPATFTVLVTKQGFATQTLTLTLSAAQQLTGVGVTLGGGVGSISGKVTLTDGSPAGGVSVKVTNGDVSVQTVTLSTGAIGTYTVGGLTVPSTYTITFSRSDLADQTRAVDLDALGTKDVKGIDASMQVATATLSGTVRQRGSDPPAPIGEVDVTLTSGSTTFHVKSASLPTPGAYEIDRIPPGTYSLSFNRTGAKPTSSIVTLSSGQRLTFNPILDLPAGLHGKVTHMVGEESTDLPGAEIRLYVASQFPNTRVRTVLTDSNGEYDLPNLDAPETYIVEYAYPAGSPGQKTVQVTTKASTTITIPPQDLST
jgi:hypothetical protein